MEATRWTRNEVVAVTRSSASETDAAPSSKTDATPEHNRSRLENGPTLDRVTFRTSDEQLAAIESLVEADVYHSRSEAIRTGIRELLERHARADADRERE